MWNRREVLSLAAVSGVAAIGVGTSSAKEQAESPTGIVDTNVSLFRWPFRRLPLDSTTRLLLKLRWQGVTEAWAGSFEAILHRDVNAANERLADECRPHPELIPIGAVNPRLPNWQRDLRECRETHQMPGIRLLPNYHGYALSDQLFKQVLREATESGLFVQIAVAMEDSRTQHERVTAEDVTLTPLLDLLPRLPKARVQLLNHRLRGAVATELAKLPGLYFDTARVDGTNGVPRLLESVGKDRVFFGSHAPFLIPESSLIRVHESGTLSHESLVKVFAENARTFRRKATN